MIISFLILCIYSNSQYVNGQIHVQGGASIITVKDSSKVSVTNSISASATSIQNKKKNFLKKERSNSIRKTTKKIAVSNIKPKEYFKIPISDEKLSLSVKQSAFMTFVNSQKLQKGIMTISNIRFSSVLQIKNRPKIGNNSNKISSFLNRTFKVRPPPLS